MASTAETSHDEAARLRDAMAEELRRNGTIITTAVERAVRTVPRHRFIPSGTPLELAYKHDHAVVTKRDTHGVVVSSVSAPFLQASMIEQAELKPGMSVLEVGSGGYNAALIAEVVGPAGRVVSVDIDKDVTDRAHGTLEATGYGDRVTVLLADAGEGIPDAGPFDALIVTVGAWDLSPEWPALLTEAGRLVIPLRMNGVTRVICFRPDGDHLTSDSSLVAGFVPMQGVTEYHEQVFHLPDGQGHNVTLRFGEQAPDEIGLLDGVLASERIELGSGVVLADGEPFDDLALWLATHQPGFCRVTTEDADMGGPWWFSFGVVRRDSFAYLSVRRAGDGDRLEFSARTYGKDAGNAMVEQIQTWDRKARHAGAPTFGYWPTGSAPGRLPAGTSTLPKHHGTVTISWPDAC